MLTKAWRANDTLPYAFLLAWVVATLAFAHIALASDSKPTVSGGSLPWEPMDILAGYEQNRRAFSGFSVVWTRSWEGKQGWYSHMDARARDLRKRIDEAKDDRAKWPMEKELQGLQSILDKLPNYGVRTMGGRGWSDVRSETPDLCGSRYNQNNKESGRIRAKNVSVK